MEQRFLRLLLIICSVVALNACEKPLAEPELTDPIYQDLRRDQADAEKGIEDKKKEIEGFEKALEKSEEMSAMERKHIGQQIFTAQKTIALMKQDANYFRLRGDTRKAIDRDTYPAIFKNKGAWPNLEEFERYRAEKRLRGVSRNWNDRVPRPPRAPTKDNPNAEIKAEPPPKAE